jgi:putative PIN family toxin of toxin-antitoxin system
VKIVLDTSILVRATERSSGLARELLIIILKSEHTLVLSNEMLFELARVLRYPRLQAVYGLSEEEVYNYVAFLRDSAEMVALNPLITAPIRDVNDVMIMQTAIAGKVDVLCTRDGDFLGQPASRYLDEMGIAIIDDIALLKRLDSQRTRS